MKKSLIFFLVLILILPLIFAFSFSDFYSKITGNVINLGGTCLSDSDGGNEIYTKGVVRGVANNEEQDFPDECGGIGYQKLHEFYCEDGMIMWDTFIECANGCYQGACLEEPATCYDSDPANSLSVKGYVTIDGGATKIYDECGYDIGYQSETMVLDSYCSASKIELDFSGYCPVACSGGVCVDESITKNERITCVFQDSTFSQSCEGAFVRASLEKFSCSGRSSCTVNLQGINGIGMFWKSDCTNANKYTTLDGTDETVTFNCNVGISPTEPPAETPSEPPVESPTGQLSISIATLKDSYSLGEQINLTDPPEINNGITGNIIGRVIQISNKITGKVTDQNDIIQAYTVLERDRRKPVSINEEIEFEGYIIQLKEEPLIVKEKELRITAERNAYGIRGFVAETSTYVLPVRFEPVTLSNIQDKIQIHINDIRDEHQSFKQKASQRISQSGFGLFDSFLSLITGNVVSSPDELIVLGEYENAFNGIALNITTEEAEELKDLSEVKEVYPNYKVYTTLIDSVQLINADDVWQLDSDGNDCSVSGQPCLTGEGITIGIIDTGVDYTHEDLGGCFGTDCKVIGGWDFVNDDNDPMDDMGHGTHVAATAAGRSPENSGDIFSYVEGDYVGVGDFLIYSEGDDNIYKEILQVTFLERISDSEFQFGYRINGMSEEIMGMYVEGDYAYSSLVSKGEVYLGHYLKANTISRTISLNFGTGADFDDPGAFVSNFADISMRLSGIAPDAKIVAYKVLDQEGSGWENDIIAAIERSVDPNQDGDFSDHLDIISLSLGGYGNPNDPQSQAIDNVVSIGVVAVIAAGNSGPTSGTIGSPGTAKKAITVGATDKSNNIASFSSRGPVVWGDINGNIKSIIKPDVVAPGVDICAAQWSNAWSDKECIDTEHTAISGTSMATPHVAGAVALLLQKNPDWTPIEVKMALRNTAINIDEDIDTQGYGKIDVLAAVNLDNKPPIAFLEISGILDGSSIDIIGTAKGDNFLSYSLYYGQGNNPSNWNEVFTSSNFVDNGILYSGFDTGLLSDGENIFKLIVRNNQGEESRDHVPVYSLRSSDSASKEGWPILIERTEIIRPNSGDLDGDGINELIVTPFSSGKIYVLNSEGEVFSEWPKQTTNNGFLFTSSAIGDLDKDGLNEIITVEGAGGAGSPGGAKSLVHAFKLNGEEITGWPVEISLVDPLHTPVVSDIDNDGNLEVIISTGTSSQDTITGEYFDNREVYVLKNDGSFMENWPVRTQNQFFPISPPIVVDLDNDGNKEIIVGTMDASNLDPARPFDTGSVEAFNIDGSIVEGFPSFNNQWNWQIMAGDINSDGFPEIFSKGFGLTNVGDPLLNFENLGHIYDILMSDLDNDGNKEIIYTDSLNVLDNEGNLLPGWPPSSFPPEDYISRQPITGDIDGDGYLEVLGVTYKGGEVYAFNIDGSVAEGFPKSMLGKGEDLILTNFDSDPNLELVGTSSFGGFSLIYVWDLDAPYTSERVGWPMFQQNQQHTGCYNCTIMDEIVDVPPIIPSARPQSKIVNDEDEDVSGTLLIKIQKKNNEVWVDSQIVINNILKIVPANGLVKLDAVFNPLEITINEIGDYRVYAEFNYGDNSVNANWEFDVLT